VAKPYLEGMTYEQLLALARSVDGEAIETVTGKRFTVGVYLDCPFFTPESSGRGQSDGRRAAERFLERYNETGSLRPSDYSDVTRNASYYVGLLFHSHSGEA
jgi:hypothetical protein